MATRNILVLGEENGFHITVTNAGFDEGFNVTIWRRNHGTAGFGAIREQEKAERIARFLYDELQPEYEAERKRHKKLAERHNAEMAKRPKPRPVKVLKNAPKIDVLICPECNALIPLDEVSDERVYECGECGTSGTGEDARRCDQCNKFTAKVSDTSCPECDAAMDDAEKTQAQRATDGTLIQVAALAAVEEEK